MKLKLTKYTKTVGVFLGMAVFAVVGGGLASGRVGSALVLGAVVAAIILFAAVVANVWVFGRPLVPFLRDPVETQQERFDRLVEDDLPDVEE